MDSSRANTTSTSPQWTRPRVQPHDLAAPLACPRPSGGHPPQKKPPSTAPQRPKHANALLARRVCRMHDYIDELRGRAGPKKYVPGAPTQPIPVPLAYGETFQDYENRFLAFLQTKNKTLDEMRDDPNHERSLRMHFATKRAKEAMGRDSKKRKLRSVSPPPGRGATNRARGVRVTTENNTVSSEDEAEADDGDDAKVREPPRKQRVRQPSPSPVRSVSTSSSQPESVSGSGRQERPTPAPLVVVERRVPLRPAAASPSPAAPAPVEQRCSAQLPDSRAPSTAFVAAYVDCGCKQCMRDWNLMLTERLLWLETEVRDLRALKRGHAVTHEAVASSNSSEQQQRPPAPEKPDAVAVQATDATSASTQPAATTQAGTKQPTPDASKAAADNSLIKADGTTAAVSSSADTRREGSNATAASSSSLAAAPASIIADERPRSAAATLSVATEHLSDPIRARMLEEYNTLNSQILSNEKVVAAMLTRVQTSMLEDMRVAMQEHEQLQQLQAGIQTDVASRDQALAMLLAYCADQPTLRAQAAKLGSLNVAHVQSASHAKCAVLATQIQATHDSIVGLQRMLERVIAGDDTAAFGRDSGRLGTASFLANGLDELHLLGEQIAGEEQALVALEEERASEFLRLFQFSYQVRTACSAILAGKERDGDSGGHQ